MDAAATRWLTEPAPRSRLGIDESRYCSVRWILDGITWKRSDPWLTSFVECSADGPASLLGLAPGRTGGGGLTTSRTCLSMLAIRMSVRSSLRESGCACRSHGATRHVFTHNDGVIDDKFVSKVPGSAKLGQRARVTEPMCRQSITDVRALCAVIAGFTAQSAPPS